MTMIDTQFPYSGLPDPDTQAEFYDSVPSKRLVAFIVDTVLVMAISLFLVLLTAFIALFFFGLLFFLVSLVYRTVTLANRSATPGMRLMAIEMRNHRGERLDPMTAFLHTLVFLFSISTVLPQVVSVMLMLTTPRRQGLGDLLLGTAAINKRAEI